MMSKRFRRVFSIVVALWICVGSLSVPAYATQAPGISWAEGGVVGKVVEWIGGTTWFDDIWGTDHSWQYASSKPQNYYIVTTVEKR